MAISDEVRRGNTQSAFDVDNIGVMGVTAMITGVLTGYNCDSWWVFLGIFLGSLLMMSIASSQVIPTIMWSVATGLLWVDWTWEWADLLGANGAYCVAILVFMCGVGVGLSGLRGIHDTEGESSGTPVGVIESIVVQIVGMSVIFGVYLFGLPF